MSLDEASQISNGLYLIKWTAYEGGGFSLAALGRDRTGKIWIAPTNWVNGHAMLEEQLDKIELMLMVAQLSPGQMLTITDAELITSYLKNYRK